MNKILRVDYRLLHGQVVFAWVNHYQINAILVANDDVVDNHMKKSSLRIAKPASSKLIFKNIDESIKAINSGVTDAYNLLIVVENIEDAERLLKGVSSIKSVNLGLSMKKQDSKMIANAVYLDGQEQQIVKNLIEKDIEVYLRQSPTDSKEIVTIEKLERI